MNRANFNCNRRLAPRRRSVSPGFTLLELLTVIGIIVILAGMLFAALKYARNSAAQSRTKAQLDTLRGMLAELDSANQFSQNPPYWLWYDHDQNTVLHGYPLRSPADPSFTVNSTSYTPDFWRYPFAIDDGASPLPVNYWDSLDSPGDVGSDGSPQQVTQRNASFAVLNTQLAMQLLATVPANREAIDKLPGNAKMLPVYSTSSTLPFVPPLDGSGIIGLLKEDGSDIAYPQFYYPQGIHVSYGGYFYFAISPPNTAVPSPGSKTPWFDESASPRGAPILLDGWSNPIIFVPATGLRVKLINGNPYYDPNPNDPNVTYKTNLNPAQVYIIVSPEGHVTNQGTANAYVDRPGRPFFASAGPDGDFTKGDDNLYSFNN